MAKTSAWISVLAMAAMITPQPSWAQSQDAAANAAPAKQKVGASASADANTPANGTLAGYNAHDLGVVQHYELTGSKGSLVDQAGSWPMFHHDPQLSGNALAPISGP